MKKSKAVRHFGGIPALARVLGIQRQAIYQWGDRIPEKHAARLEKASDGKLVYRVSDYQKKKPQQAAAGAA